MPSLDIDSYGELFEEKKGDHNTSSGDHSYAKMRYKPKQTNNNNTFLDKNKVGSGSSIIISIMFLFS